MYEAKQSEIDRVMEQAMTKVKEMSQKVSEVVFKKIPGTSPKKVQ